MFERVAATFAEGRFASARQLGPTTYVIAMLPRTGSTALCSLLARTGQLGFPDEYLNPRGPIQYWAEEFGATNVRQYLDVLGRERATPNGVFALKTTYDDFSPLVESRSVSHLLGDARFIYLTRDDVVAQAVSEFIAEESGVWHRDSAGRPIDSERSDGEVAVEFDRQRIVEILGDLARMKDEWERFFTAYSASPLRISYEQLCADAQAVVSQIATFVGVDWSGEITLADARTSKMATELNAEWAERIRASFVL